jgi:hypothetical protein
MGKRAHIADGYERVEPVTADVAGAAALRARRAKAQAAVAARNERRWGKRRFTS